MELVELVSQPNTAERLRLILGRIVNNPDVPYWGTKLPLEIPHGCLYISVSAALNKVLIDVLDALKFILLVASRSITVVAFNLSIVLINRLRRSVCIGIEEVEKFNECVVRHLLASVTLFLSLNLDIIVLVVLEVLVVSLGL